MGTVVNRTSCCYAVSQNPVCISRIGTRFEARGVARETKIINEDHKNSLERKKYIKRTFVVLGKLIWVN